MVDVTVAVTIDEPRAYVAEYAADPSNVPNWYRNIKTVELLTDGPLRVGSQMAFVAQFLGHTLSYTYEVVDLVSGERLVMRTAQGPFPMETTYSWETIGDATLMKMRNRGEPAGFSRFVAPFMATAIRRATQKDLTRLKALLETT